MGLYMFFSLVARAATLGNSCNLHKSKMAAMWGRPGLVVTIFNQSHFFTKICKLDILFGRDPVT